jgi:hypothetical protein
MASLYIIGIEATQATQYFRSFFLQSNGQFAPDNSIPLVAGKKTVLRVYISGGTPGYRVSATAIPVSPPVPGFAALRVGSGFTAGNNVADRRILSSTSQIDFTITDPGSWDFDILAVEYPPTPNYNPPGISVPFRIRLTFEERRKIRIRLVRIRYSSVARNLNVAAPLVADFWKTAMEAQKTLPVPSPGFSIYSESEELYDGNFTSIDPGAHSSMWPGKVANDGTTGNLLNIMDRLVTAENLPPDVIYVGIYPDGVNQAAFIGWAVSRWIITDKSGSTLAHEVGHKLGRPHAPCGNPAWVDTNFPMYGSFPSGSIGEVGIDTITFSLKDPATTFDLMSYCSPNWISAYNYQLLFNALPPLPPETPRETFDLGPVYLPIDLNLIMDRWVKSDLPALPATFLPRPPRGKLLHQGGKGNENLLIQKAKNGEVLDQSALYASALSTENDPEKKDLLQSIALLHNKAAILEVLLDGKKIWEDTINKKPIRLQVIWPKPNKNTDGSFTIKWSCNQSPSYFILRAGSLKNNSWTASLISGESREHIIDKNIFLQGVSFKLELIAIKGFLPTIDQSNLYPPLVQVRKLLVISPEENQIYTVGEPIRLEAVSRNPESILQWYSQQDGKIGEGSIVLSEPLSSGLHTIEARSNEPFEEPVQINIKVIDKKNKK